MSRMTGDGVGQVRSQDHATPPLLHTGEGEISVDVLTLVRRRSIHRTVHFPAVGEPR